MQCHLTRPSDTIDMVKSKIQVGAAPRAEGLLRRLSVFLGSSQHAQAGLYSVRMFAAEPDLTLCTGPSLC